MNPTTRTDGSDIVNDDPPNATAGGAKDGLFKYTKESITEEIEWYLEESQWEKTEEDADADTNDRPESMEKDETQQNSKFLYRVEILQLVNALSAFLSENKPESKDERKKRDEMFLDLIRRNLPIGVNLSPKKLLGILHPDRFLEEDTKGKAHTAFTGLQNILEERKPGHIQGMKDTDKTYVEILEQYHMDGQKSATPHLRKLYEAFQKGEEIRPQYSVELSDTVKAAHASLREINDKIQGMNEEVKNPKELGNIEVSKLISSWGLVRDTNEKSSLYETCERYHYPSGWHYQPPREEYDYNKYRVKDQVRSDFQQKLVDFYMQLPETYGAEEVAHVADEIMRLQSEFEKLLATANRVHDLPERLHIVDLTKILPAYCGLKKFKSMEREDHVAEIEHELHRFLELNGLPLEWSPFRKTEWDDFSNGPAETNPEPGTPSTPSTPKTPWKPSTAQNETTRTKLLTNGKMILEIPQRSIKKAFRAGYTTSGDRIIALQRMGLHSASFVVEANGCHRIVSFGSAGGKPVLRAAKEKGIPFTTHDVALLNQKIDAGGGYEILFIAMGLWDLEKTTANGNPKLPLVVAGLGFLKPEIGPEYVSRSTLGQVIGNSAAQHEISSAMGGDADEDILSTMLSKMDIADIADRPHLVRYQNQRNQKLLTYPGPMMTMNAPVYPTSWQTMQAPYNFQSQQGFQQPPAPWASPSVSQKPFQGYQQGFQQPYQGFHQFQQPYQGFHQLQQPQTSFRGFQQGSQQPQGPWASQSGSRTGFQGYQPPQGPWASQPGTRNGVQGHQQPQKGPRHRQKPRGVVQAVSQAGQLFEDWSNLSRNLMGPGADLADFSDDLHTTVPDIIKIVNETEDSWREANKKRFQEFHSYNSKDKLKKVLKEWSQNIQSAPSAREVGYALGDLYSYLEQLGDLDTEN